MEVRPTDFDFQSHNGAIAASLSSPAAPADLAFNPTMVRLLQKMAKVVTKTEVLSIPQWCDCCVIGLVGLIAKFVFQSHNGAIAAHRHLVAIAHRCSFNPTMVRLLRTTFKDGRSPELIFQSHNGAIAAFTVTRRRGVVQAFNPTMVRLLRQHTNPDDEGCFTFNPTMVRLLPDGWRLLASWCGFFQSHNGAIAATLLPAPSI